MLEYDAFDVSIEPDRDGRYAVRVLDSPAGEADDGYADSVQ